MMTYRASPHEGIMGAAPAYAVYGKDMVLSQDKKITLWPTANHEDRVQWLNQFRAALVDKWLRKQPKEVPEEDLPIHTGDVIIVKLTNQKWNEERF